MSKHIWIEDAERTAVLTPYAARAWAARDSAELHGTVILFDGCRYDTVHDQGDEFTSGSTSLRDGGTTYRTDWRDDVLSRAVEAVVAWRLIRLLTNAVPSLPDSIEIAFDLVLQQRRNQACFLRRIFMGAAAHNFSRTASDPQEIARLEFSRLLFKAICREGVFPPWGLNTIIMHNGISVRDTNIDSNDIVVAYPDGGITPVHPVWKQRIRDAVAANQQADPSWRERKAKWDAEPYESDMAYI